MLHAPTRREMLLGSGVLFAWTQLPKLARAEGRDPRLLAIVLLLHRLPEASGRALDDLSPLEE